MSIPRPTPCWLTVSVRDDFTRGLLRDGLHQAIHERRGPLLELVEDVLKDSGVRLAAIDEPKV